ncbi:MAG: TspO/MBR family protein [Acidithiobacillus sp.]|uniref:TspO/MBR family protein n=1 Tax=Acidithiobacillus sp. TaxID=1872118 RepID=UPI003D08A560
MIVLPFPLVATISLALTLAVASSGSLFRPDAWYERLRKPKLMPPGWVFPVVWTALYVLMALAAAEVFVHYDARLRSWALALYALQLVANAAWSWLFFKLHRPLWALWDLILLWILVLACILIFAQIETLAALLLVPYGFWLLIALYLNAATWALNRPMRR